MRSISPLWEDEIEEISHLISVKHLITQYLPSIPGALPGHYLLALLVNHISPGNKFLLGIPGLFAHIAVFFLIPTAIFHLHIVDKKDIPLLSLITRAAFVFDPRLTYQSMEVRPYSFLPLLWIFSVIVCSQFFKLNNSSLNQSKIFYHLIILTLLVTAIFLWHFYGFIMVISIYVFMYTQQSENKNILTRSLYPIIVGTIISLPLWKYFTSGLSHYRHDTFGFISNISGIATIYNFIYFLMFLLILYMIRKHLFLYIREIKIGKLVMSKIVRILIYLVITPIVIIFILDVIQPYYFLYRQFSWVAIPFYIAMGILINILLRNKNNLKKYRNDYK